MGETTMMASATAVSQTVNETRTMGEIIDGQFRARLGEMTITASRLPAETMPEAIAIRISETMGKIPRLRILEAKIPDPTRASRQITIGTIEIRSAMVALIAIEQGRMPPPISDIRIPPPMAVITGRETRSSRQVDRRDRRIMSTTLRNSPPMRTTEVAGIQADRISRMEMMTEVLASSRLEDRRDHRIMTTTLRNSPPMRTTEIAETQADRINFQIHPNRMEMTTEVLGSSRLEDRRDRRIMTTTLRNSPPPQTTEVVETQGDHINSLIHPNRMEVAIKVLVSSRQEDRQDQLIMKVPLRIPRNR
jgi:hypothetical protein